VGARFDLDETPAENRPSRMTERSGGWKGGRWRILAGDRDVSSLVSALAARGVDFNVSESDDADVVLVMSPADVTSARSIAIPLSLIDAPPELVAEHVLALAHAALAERTLKRWQAEQSEMVESLTHDLKNPLAVLRANLEYLRGGDLGGDAEAAEAIDDASDAVLRVDQLVEDIRMVDALEQQTLTVGRLPISLSTLGESLSALGDKVAGRKSATVQVNLPGSIIVLGDVQLVRVLLERLVVGRIRHVGRHGRVLVAGRVENDRVLLTVADTGAPIAEELCHMVFDKSGPGRMRSRDLGDVGVGLYLSRLIVTAMGGRIALSEDPAWPTCFLVDLPAAC